MDAPPRQPTPHEPSSDPDGWRKAIPIGVLAGVPTAVFLQVGFVATLRARGDAVKPSRLFGLAPPGLGLAVARDCVYWAATQKQVQTPRPTWREELACQVCVVGVPLVCDTLSVRAVEPQFRWPRTPGSLVLTACPPVALLGRATWIPVYNWAYVRTQQTIGDDTWWREGLGLVAGSLAASVVAYPLFVLKTNMLLQQHVGGGEAVGAAAGGAPVARGSTTTLGSVVAPGALARLVGRSVAHACGAPSLGEIPKRGVVAALRSLFSGLRPHAIANIGPDVVCMAAARAVYAFVCARLLLDTGRKTDGGLSSS